MHFLNHTRPDAFLQANKMRRAIVESERYIKYNIVCVESLYCYVNELKISSSHKKLFPSCKLGQNKLYYYHAFLLLCVCEPGFFRKETTRRNFVPAINHGRAIKCSHKINTVIEEQVAAARVYFLYKENARRALSLLHAD